MKRGTVILLGITLVVGTAGWGLLGASEPVNLYAPEVKTALEIFRARNFEAHIRFLADDLLEGRATGTRGHELAAAYVATRFQAAGLKPAGDDGSYFQIVRLRNVRATGGSLTLVRDGEETSFTYGEDFVPQADAGRTQTSVYAQAVFVGYGVSAPALGYDDYAGVDVKGKIVVLLPGTPSSLPGDHRAHLSSGSVKAATAAVHGAVGILNLRGARSRFPLSAMARRARRGRLRWLTLGGQPGNYLPQLQGKATLSKQTAQKLFEGAPKSLEQVYADAPKNKPQSFPLPVSLRLSATSEHSEITSPNVVAVLPGSDPNLRDEYVIFSAHLDHIGISQRAEGDKINNGAYDNASGSAALLEIARIFGSLPQAPRRSILFLALTAEERGLLGSDFFAQYPTVPKENIVANVNMDTFLMLFPSKDVVAFGAEHSSLEQVVRQAARHVGLDVSPDPIPERRFFVRSDQYSFVKQGVPSTFLFSGLNSADAKVDGPAMFQNWMRTIYHRPSDDMSQEMHFESGIKILRANFLIGYLIANQDERPSWKPGDFFGETFGGK